MIDPASQILLFRDPFLASLLMAMVLSLLGLFVLLRRMVFVGISLSQMAALGCAVAFLAETFAVTAPGRLLAPLRDHWLMVILFEFLGILILVRADGGRLSREARLGICWAAAGAASVLLVSRSARGMEELRTLLTGEILYVGSGDLVILAVCLVPCAAALVIFFRRFLLVAFDREMAVSLGVRARLWDLLFFLVLGLSIAVSIHLSGVLFTVGFLVLPPSAALLLGGSPWVVAAVSIGLGLAAASGGFFASYAWDLPTGPSQVSLAFVLLLLLAASAAAAGGWKWARRAR